MQISDLPHLNVALNAMTAVWLTAGYAAIRTRHIRLHAAMMICAMVSALAFFTSYGIYHYNIGSKPYEGVGALRTVYYAILISHVVLAAVNLPLIIVTASRAARRRFEAHRRIARLTLPIWWYVSVTGVVVYVMLYWPIG